MSMRIFNKGSFSYPESPSYTSAYAIPSTLTDPDFPLSIFDCLQDSPKQSSQQAGLRRFSWAGEQYGHSELDPRAQEFNMQEPSFKKPVKEDLLNVGNTFGVYDFLLNSIPEEKPEKLCVVTQDFQGVMPKTPKIMVSQGTQTMEPVAPIKMTGETFHLQKSPMVIPAVPVTFCAAAKVSKPPQTSRSYPPAFSTPPGMSYSRSPCSSPESSVEHKHPVLIKLPNRELQAEPGCGYSKFKGKLCHGFLQNQSCPNGAECNYMHALPLSVSAKRIISLEGLPLKCNREALVKELKANNVPVLNVPVVIDRFTPRVVLKSANAAKYFLRKKKITLTFNDVDYKVLVYPYKPLSEVHQVSLHGLKGKIGAEDIESALAQHKCKLVNEPTKSKGVASDVRVGNKAQQKRLLALGSIKICGKLVEIKPISKKKERLQDMLW